MADAPLPDEPIKTQPLETLPIEDHLIKTQRLTLREARKFDLTAFHELYTNREVMRYWATPHATLSQTETYLRKMYTSSLNGELGFVIVLPPSASTATSSTGPVPTAVDEGKVIGHAGIWHPQRNELVFMIGRAYWGQGYMTEVLAAVVPIFWEKGLRKVHADVNPENEASLKVLRNLGFRQAGENIVEESYVGWGESLRMELSNPDGGGEGEEDVDSGDPESDSSSGDNDRG